MKEELDAVLKKKIKPKKNWYRDNDALQKLESNGSLTWCRQQLLRHCHWTLTRRYVCAYIFIICVNFVLRTSIDLIKENGFTLKKGTKQLISRRNYDRRKRQFLTHNCSLLCLFYPNICVYIYEGGLKS